MGIRHVRKAYYVTLVIQYTLSKYSMYQPWNVTYILTDTNMRDYTGDCLICACVQLQSKPTLAASHNRILQ
jgi:hypothetical protein